MTASNSSVQLSLKRLRKDPRFTLVDVVEKYVQFPPPGHRVDLWGVIDIIAIGPGITLAVQATTKGGLSSHKRKIAEHPSTPLVLEAGWVFELHGWHKPAHRWECRVIQIELEGAAT